MNKFLWRKMDDNTKDKYNRLVSRIGGLTLARNKLLLDAQGKAEGYTRKIQESRAELEALEILDKGGNKNETK